MNNASLNQMLQLYDFILECGNAPDYDSFITCVLTGLKILCPHEQSVVFCTDGNSKVYSNRLEGLNPKWINLYLAYYSKFTEDPYFGNIHSLRHAAPCMNVIKWAKEPVTEFLTDYIRPLRLKASLGVTLYDLDGLPRTIIALDRIQLPDFTSAELQFMELALPLLNNLHKHLVYHQNKENSAFSTVCRRAQLTARETQITDLLCKGLSPSTISDTLSISKGTINKHIEHIYKKLNVSSRQELLLRFLE